MEHSRKAVPKAYGNVAPPLVFLVGDSIRMGYEPHVRRELEGGFAVAGPAENCEDSAKVLARLESWLPDGVAVAHVNCGLHDVKRAREGPLAGRCQVVLDGYRENVRAILRLALERCRRVVWATTTPVVEDRHRAAKEFDRLNADVLAYNEAAVGIARSLGVPANDLHAAVASFPGGAEAAICADGVHFADDGGRRLAREVARFVRNVAP
jgi:hypothetical protein